MYSLLIPAFLGAFTFSSLEGDFLHPHVFSMPGYEDEASCQEGGGEWGTQGCTFEDSDEISIKLVGTTYQVEVSTVATSGHSCLFEGSAEYRDGEIVATAEGEVWSADRSAPAPAACEVRLHFEDADTVTVTNNGKCWSFCGGRATLDVWSAKRVDPAGN